MVAFVFPPLSLRILESLNKQHGRAACTAQRCGCITRVSPQLNLTHLVHRRRESHGAVCCVSPLNRAAWPAERDAEKERGGNATLSWHSSGSRRPSLGMTPPHLSLQISSLSCFFLISCCFVAPDTKRKTSHRGLKEI